MWNIEMSDVNCLVCNTQFSESDVGVMEEWEFSICDLCIEDMCSFKVKYDGSSDLLEILTQEIKGSKCAGCLKPDLELNGIHYGSQVWRHGGCSSYKQGWSFLICLYIRTFILYNGNK